MEANGLEDIHLFATNVFQNVSTLTPMLRTLVTNAKQYQKSVHGTCQLAHIFVDSLAALADAAKATQGATQFVGDVLTDIMRAYKDLEDLKMELMRLFINEIIIPFESKAEQEIISVKTSFKDYTKENKIHTEEVEKATQEVIKVRKKTQRRKSKPGKYDDKERESVMILKDAEQKLRDIREKGLRTALIEERRVYCFVAERMCSFGQGMISYNNRISNFMQQKIPEWQLVIAKPTELPAESEVLIKQPSRIDTATMRRKSEKRGTVKAKPAPNNRNETGPPMAGSGGLRYHTIDGRAASVGMRPPIQKMTSPSAPVTPSPRSTSPPRFEYPDNKPESLAPINPPPLLEDEEDVKPIMMPDRSKTMSSSLRSALTEQLNSKFKQVHPQEIIELKAIYSHSGQDPSQLSFTKGDLIVPVCEPTSGWQYGENKSTGEAGWFPAAYVEKLVTDAKTIDPMATLPNRSSENFNRGNRSTGEERMKRFSTPNRKYQPALPERDYDFEESEPSSRDSESYIVNGNGRLSPGRRLPTSASVPEMNIQYIEQKEHERSASLSPLANVLQNSIEDSIIPSPPSSVSSTEAPYENQYMPPPPPPPQLSPYGDEIYEADDGQGNPFANIRLKRTVTDDRSSPRVA